jgi:hypothetical protein
MEAGMPNFSCFSLIRVLKEGVNAFQQKQFEYLLQED